MGCSRARHRADGGVCHSSVRQRTTANEPANHGPRFTPHCWLTRHTPRTTPTQAHPRWRPGGSAPQTPRDLSPLCQARRENRNGTHSASRLRSWPLSRRSGRVSASPCPPLRSLTILSAIESPNHSPCAPAPQPMPPGPGSPRTAESGSDGQIRFLGGHARSRTAGSACVLRDPRRSFFSNAPQISAPTPFPAESSATR